MDDYDQAYGETTDLFGADPEDILVRRADLLPQGCAVLDIGCGQGRNALWLAARGFDVLGLDPSAEALKQLRLSASEADLAVRTRLGSFGDLLIESHPTEVFGGVCVFGLLQILRPGEIEDLRRAITAVAAPGALLFLTAWTTDDPRYPEIAATWTPLGGGTFTHPDGRVRTYLEPGAVLDLFPGWEVLHHREELGPWHRHGDTDPERHGVVLFVARGPGLPGHGNRLDPRQRPDARSSG